MGATKGYNAAKRLFSKENRRNRLLGIVSWGFVSLGVILLSLGLWSHFHNGSSSSIAIYKDDSVCVKASYGKDAKIPEKAELRAYLVTWEADPDGYAQKMAAAVSALDEDNESVPMNAICNGGFYAGNQEVEPAAPVNVALQVLKDGFTAGEAVRVVHLGENQAQVIADTKVDENGFVSFTTDGFSDFTFIFGNGANISVTSDLSGFIVSAELRDKNGNLLKDGDEIVLGEKYSYKVRFEEKGDKQFQTPMFFQLPEGFMADIVENQPIEKDGMVVGHYSIDKNGFVTFNMNETYLKEHPDVWLETTFNMTAAEAKDGKGIEFPWNGGEKKTFGTKGKAEVLLNKKAGEYDPVDHTIKYTVTLDVTNGVVKDTAITDVMEKGVSLMTDESGNPTGYAITVTDANGKEVKLDPAPTLEKKANGWVTKGLPDPLPKGYKVTIDYKAAVEFEDEGTKVQFEAGETQYHFTVENTATVDCNPTKGEDAEVGGTMTDTETKTVDDKLLEKDGTLAAGNSIDWEISVGSGGIDVRGVTLTDTLGNEGDQWVDTSKPLEIKWKNGSGTLKTKTIEWIMKDGQVDKEAMITQGITDIMTNTEGRIIGFKVMIPDKGNEFWNKDGRTWSDGDWVKVEYYTKYNPPADGTSIPYTNTVTGLSDAVPPGVGEIVIGSGGIKKDLVKDAYDASNDYVEYSITVRVPAKEELLRQFRDGKPAYSEEKIAAGKLPYFYIQDQLEFPAVVSYDANGNKVETRYFVDNIPEITEFKAIGENSGEITFTEQTSPVYNNKGLGYTYSLVHNSGTDKSTREFQIWFNSNFLEKSEGDYHDSVWPINEDVTITITYRVPGDSKIVKEVQASSDSKGIPGIYEDTDYTLRELLESGSRLDNEVWGRFRADDDKIFETENKYTKTPTNVAINKRAQLLENNEIQYNVSFDNSYKDANGGEHHLHLFSDEEIESFRFEDTFDSRLEYVSGSLEVMVLEADGSPRGVFKVSDDDKIKIIEDGMTTTLSVSARDFDSPSAHGLYGRDSLYMWLYKHQTSSGKKEDGGHMSSEGNKDSRYVFRYKLRVKDEYLKAEELILDNIAHVKYGDTDLHDTEQVKTSPNILEKTSELLKNEGGQTVNEVKYTIEVNPGAIDLAQGTSESGETRDLERYTLTDIMSEGLIPDWKSVEIKFEGIRDGKKVEGTLTRTDGDSEVTLNSFKYTVSLEGENGMKFVVPDELKLTITYTVMLDTTNYGMDIHGTNTVSLDGKTSIADKDDTIFHVEVSKALTGAGDNIWLYKRDADTKALIDGSEFRLYKQDSNGSMIVQPTGGTAIKLKETDETYKPSAKTDQETGRQGTPIPKPKDTKADDYFVLVETKAPDGYELDPTPVVFKFDKAPAEGPEEVQVILADEIYNVTVQYCTSGDNIVVDNIPVQYQYTLPETGGSGNSILYLWAGLVLAFGCGMVLLSWKRSRRVG